MKKKTKKVPYCYIYLAMTRKHLCIPWSYSRGYAIVVRIVCTRFVTPVYQITKPAHRHFHFYCPFVICIQFTLSLLIPSTNHHTPDQKRKLIVPSWIQHVSTDNVHKHLHMVYKSRVNRYYNIIVVHVSSVMLFEFGFYSLNNNTSNNCSCGAIK